MRKISLWCKEGSSDKIYNIQLEKSGDGYVVNAQNGRRGSTLVPRTKTDTPVSLAEAEKIFDALVREKRAKSYKIVEGSESGYTSTTASVPKEVILLPQLLNTIEEDVVENFINDDNYLAQEKKDGERRIVIFAEDKNVGLNKKGTEVALPNSIIESVLGVMTLDAEIIGEKLFVFDLLSNNGKDITGRGCLQRLSELSQLKSDFGKSIEIVETAYTKEEKRALYERLKAENKEGIVFKKKNAPYTAGRPSSGGNQFKNKFQKTATFIVKDHTKGKRSVGLELISENAKVFMGKVTIPPNKEIPKIGDLVEVQYLYAYRGGAIFQPVYKDKRTDSDLTDATISQIVYKAE